MNNSILVLLLTLAFSSTLTFGQRKPLRNTDLFPEPDLNITEYCQALGYPIEAHKIVTSDGYILTYFRLQAKGSQIKAGREVVYFQHGLFDSSDLALMNSEDKAPGFMLANRGYDVWLGNSRGNWHSQENTHLNPELRQFWQFTWQDMATKDLPAAFEYITNLTGKDKINYIGHSQGTMIMHAALAMRLESITSRVKHIISTGPVAYVGNVTTKLVKALMEVNGWYQALDLYGYWDVLNPDMKQMNTTSALCVKAPFLCNEVLRLLMDLMPDVDNTKRWTYYLHHFPCGTSLMNLHHWQQLVQTDKFQLYDYGRAGNQRQYGQPTPPQLKLSAITEDIHLFAGDTDELADPVDVIRLYNDLTASTGKTLHMYHMGHGTFLFGKNMQYMEEVFKILES